MDSFQITISLPHKALSPNARCHWSVKAKQTKHQRHEAKALAVEALLDVPMDSKWPQCTVRPVFYHRTRHKRDRDNCSASLKAARDGIADAMTSFGFIEDDSGFIPLPPVLRHDKDHPRVEITVTARTDVVE